MAENNDYMENLARAYNARLHSEGAVTDSGLLNEALEIVERQINCIDLILAGVRQSNRALAYLKSLKQASVRELNALGAGSKVPTYRFERCGDRCRGSVFNTLVDLQIDLFITLDRLKADGVAVDNLLMNETRALGFIGVLR